MMKWVDDSRSERVVPSSIEAPLPTSPRAAGTCSIPRIDTSLGAIVVFADDRAIRAQICDHVRDRDFVPLPIATGLDAVLTLERTSPRLAIIAGLSLGATPDEIVDFLGDEHPAIETVLLAPHVDARLFDRVARWARELRELDGILDQLATAPLGRALVLATNEPLRRAICALITDLGWEAICAAEIDEAEQTLSSQRFDTAIVGRDGATARDDLARLRRIAPGLPTMVFSSTTPAAPPSSPTVAALFAALNRLAISR